MNEINKINPMHKRMNSIFNNKNGFTRNVSVGLLSLILPFKKGMFVCVCVCERAREHIGIILNV